MGRGDKKTAKGKRFQGSFGKSRPAKASKSKKPVVKASQQDSFSDGYDIVKAVPIG